MRGIGRLPLPLPRPLSRLISGCSPELLPLLVGVCTPLLSAEWGWNCRPTPAQHGPTREQAFCSG